MKAGEHGDNRSECDAKSDYTLINRYIGCSDIRAHDCCGNHDAYVSPFHGFLRASARCSPARGVSFNHAFHTLYISSGHSTSHWFAGVESIRSGSKRRRGEGHCNGSEILRRSKRTVTFTIKSHQFRYGVSQCCWHQLKLTMVARRC